MKKLKKEILSWILTLGIPVAVVLLLNLFVGKIVVVKGDSMYSTLHNRDVMIVRTISYQPKQGDIVVIKTDPTGILNGDNIVKRIIATEGQSVKIDYDTNTVYVDGQALKEDYINKEDTDPMESGKFLNEKTEFTVPAGRIFVMGDNRNHSTDSRDVDIGMIKNEDVMGKEEIDIPVGKLLGTS